MRKDLKLTQKELAFMLGVTQQAIAKYEAGSFKLPSARLALRIEQATNGQVTRDELLFPELYESKQPHQDTA